MAFSVLLFMENGLSRFDKREKKKENFPARLQLI